MIETVRELRSKGLTIKEIANESGLSRYAVEKILLEHKFPKAVMNVTGRQFDFLIGNVIGDGCIYGSGNKNHNYRMNLAHSLKQKDYFMTKYRVLESIVKSKPRERTWTDKRTNKQYSEIRFQSVANEFYTDLHKKWYENGKKIINLDELRKCGAVTLAIKYFDDGCKASNGNYYISMDDYSDECIRSFMQWMHDEFGIDSTVHSNRSIYIPGRSKSKMSEILSLINSSDVSYKI